ncbi:MAG: DUF2975 domain-containing protein [Undibacterium sp.]|nr:DUF2975 domain-containing protein [Undibacterium sp.]
MKIATQCQSIRVLLCIVFLFQCLFFVLAWSNIPLDVAGLHMYLTPSGLSFAQMGDLMPSQRLIGTLLGLPNIVAMAYGFWHLYALLISVQHRAIFSMKNIVALRSFAGAGFLATLATILELPLRHLCFKIFTKVDDRQVSFSITSEQLMLILVSCLFYLVINIMHEGRRLAEENEGFI